MSLLLSLHLLAAIIWVGGMFFAHMVLRPTAVEVLEPPLRLTQWVGVFQRFFRWVWLAVLLLPISGLWLMFVYYGGFEAARFYIHIMNGLGFLMIGLYVWLYFKPYAALRQAVQSADWPLAASHLNRIRMIVTSNLILGLVTSVVAVAGRYL